MTVSLKQKINQLGQQGITQVNPKFHISSYPKDLSSLLLHCSYQSVSGRQFKQVIRIQKQLQQEQLVPENGSCNSCPLLPAETQKLLTLLTRELRIMQRKGVSKDWVQEALKKQRRDARNVNQYISRKNKTLPFVGSLGSVTDLFCLYSKRQQKLRAASLLQRFLLLCSKWIMLLQKHHSAGHDFIRKKTFCCKGMTKIRAEHLFEKISFANALLEFFISGREGEKVPFASSSYLPWLSGRVGMFNLLSAEQAWLHFLQAALTPLRAAFESRSPELLFQVCRSALGKQPPSTDSGVH